jgi:hypothetical protein
MENQLENWKLIGAENPLLGASLFVFSRYHLHSEGIILQDNIILISNSGIIFPFLSHKNFGFFWGANLFPKLVIKFSSNLIKNYLILN